jgi:phage-related minor tail protein
MTDDTRDRVIRHDAQIDHMAEQIEDMQKKVSAMHELLMQAKGMKYLIVIMAAIAGFFASFASKYIPFVR